MDIPQWISDLPPIAVALASAVIALFSLLISSASMLVNWKNYRRDLHRVEVELRWNAEMEMMGGPSSKVKRCFAHIKVRNRGRRPVHIDMICLELPGRTRQANWLDESITLVEGGPSKIVKVAQDSTLAPFLPQWKKIFATAVDNTGQTYKSKRGQEVPHILPGEEQETRRRLREIKWPLNPEQLSQGAKQD